MVLYCNDNRFVKIEVKCNYKKLLLKNNIYLTDPSLLISVLDNAYNYYYNRKMNKGVKTNKINCSILIIRDEFS